MATQKYLDMTTVGVLGFYNESKEFVVRYSSNAQYFLSPAIPSGVKYVRYASKSPVGNYEDGMKFELGDTATPWQPAPEDLLPTGATEGYFIAGRDGDTFDFNDWAYYSQPIQNFSKLLWFAESIEI